MRVVRGVHDACLPPCVLTIGNFDGLHRGHATVLNELKTIAARQGLATAVLTFEPHPREVFTPESAPARLSSLREKLEYFARAGIDYVVVQRFDSRFAGIDAETFRDRIVIEHLNARHVLVGDDFRFGARRGGDFAFLKHNPRISAGNMPTMDYHGERISSTAVRAALSAGNLELAERLLGRPYSISGRVVQGDRLGRQLGFPTANIEIRHNRPPLFGIFVVEVHGLGQPVPGVASLGRRPTVKNPDARPVLEVHLFDFNQDIYRRHLRVDFLQKLRNEEKYPDLASLTAQIAKDCENARAWHAARHEKT